MSDDAITSPDPSPDSKNGPPNDLPPVTKLDWADVQQEAESLFNCWSGAPSVWAEKAWQILDQDGLTTYRDAVEEAAVRIRLLTLAIFVWDLLWLVHQERWEESELAGRATEQVGIEAFRVAQLVGRDYHAADFDFNSDDLFAYALIDLSDSERARLSKVLIRGFGGEKQLLVAMENALESGRDDEEQAVVCDYPAEVCVLSQDAGRVFAWVLSGMHRL